MTAPGIDREGRREEVRALYGPEHAARYEDTWQNSEIWSRESKHYIRTITELLPEGGRWLDVGCGTGYFLGRFPGVERAGVDLSPSMLEHARANNPDAVELREADISVDQPDWHGRWDLVTSTGQAWGYLPTMDLIEQAARNMAAWTATGGVLMVQPADLTDLTGHRLDYDFSGERPPANTTVVTGAVWTYYEDDDVHRNQIWPSLDQWVNWLAHDFEHIEIFNWPHDPPPPYLAYPRRVVVARNKRETAGAARATIAFEPLPGPVVPDGPPEPAVAAPEPPTEITEITEITEANEVGTDEPAPERVAPTQDQPPAPGLADAAGPDAAIASLRSVASRIYHLPLADIVETYAPWRGRVWRGMRRRLPGPDGRHR